MSSVCLLLHCILPRIATQRLDKLKRRRIAKRYPDTVLTELYTVHCSELSDLCWFKSYGAAKLKPQTKKFRRTLNHMQLKNQFLPLAHTVFQRS